MSDAALLAPLPPRVPGLPILGNALDMANDIIGFCVTQYRARGPIFSIRALNREMVVLAGPEANLFITQHGADKFSARETWTPLGHELDADVYLQSVDGERHITFRKLMKRSYSASMMTSNLPLLVDIAQTAIDRLPIGSEMSALQLFRLIVTEQLGQMLTGHAVGDDLETMTTFLGMSLKALVTKTAPAFTLRQAKYRQAKARVIALGREIIEQHRTTQRAQPDLVDDVLAAGLQHPDLLGSEGQMLEAVLGPFSAGLDTVSNECTFLLYALFQNPKVLERCISEADILFAGGVPQAAQLRALDTIHHAMMETLRLYSIAPGITRQAAQTFTFAGHRVEKGQPLFLATTVPHFLPELFPNPSAFDIDRYTEPRNEHRQRGAFSPFGIGTHTCLGAGAAETQMMLVMATVLHMLRLEWVNSGEKLKIKQDPTPTLGAKFQVRLVERRHRIIIDKSHVGQPISVLEN